PQEDNLDPDFSVRYNLLVYARYFGIELDEAKEKAEELLKKVELTDKADQEINNLSGGMKRRLIVARGMINEPELLILDEPTTGLDPQSRHSVWDQIRIFKNEGKTVLLTTHYMDEAEILCDQLAIMDSGRILIQGNPKELIKKTIGDDAAELVALSFGKDEETLNLIEKKCKLMKVSFSRVTDRIILYGKEIENIISEFNDEENLTDIIRRRATLEDVFLNLTGRQLRDYE
ncbi:MAG: ATP-binding cassette domain-containing protein, partial [Candidatus Poseidoniia archaeon]|nr:ATP-binding cassette domain-containing protein [Candidatus Poseidoniia archaeon]